MREAEQMDVDVTEIQPGWTVYDSNGDEVGKVTNAEGRTIVVARPGLLGEKHLYVPGNVVSAIETGRVDLSTTRKEIEQEQ
jgi:hypothetical protein